MKQIRANVSEKTKIRFQLLCHVLKCKNGELLDRLFSNESVALEALMYQNYMSMPKLLREKVWYYKYPTRKRRRRSKRGKNKVCDSGEI